MNEESNKQEIKTLIEFELAQIQNGRADDGWNPWLLYASLGGLTWSAINDVDKPHNWNLVALFFCLFTVSLFALKRINGAITVGGQECYAGSRFIPTDWSLASSRGHLIVNETKLLVSAFIIYQYIQLSISTWQSIVWFLLFGAYALAFLFGVTVTFFRFPLPRSIGSLRIWTILEITACLFIISMAYLMARVQLPNFEIADLKFALLIFGIAEIFTIALDYKAESPTKALLVQIRRSIGLGEISDETALERTKIALYGLRFGQFLEPQINQFFAAVTIMDSKIKEKSKCLDVLIKEYSKVPLEIDFENLKTLSLQVKRQTMEIDAAIKTAKMRGQKIALWTGILIGLDNSVKDEVDQFQQRVNDQIKSLTETETKITAQQDTVRELAIQIDKRRAELAMGDPKGAGHVL